MDHDCELAYGGGYLKLQLNLSEGFDTAMMHSPWRLVCNQCKYWWDIGEEDAFHDKLASK